MQRIVFTPGGGPWVRPALTLSDTIPLNKCESVLPGQQRPETYPPFTSSVRLLLGVMTWWCMEGCADRLYALSNVHVWRTLKHPPGSVAFDPDTTMAIVCFNSAVDFAIVQVDPFYTRYLDQPPGHAPTRPLTFPAKPRQMTVGDLVYVIRGQLQRALHYMITSTVSHTVWLHVYEAVGPATIAGTSGSMVVTGSGEPVAVHQSDMSCIPLSAMPLSDRLNGRPVFPVPTGTWTQMGAMTRELSTMVLQ